MTGASRDGSTRGSARATGGATGLTGCCGRGSGRTWGRGSTRGSAFGTSTLRLRPRVIDARLGARDRRRDRADLLLRARLGTSLRARLEARLDLWGSRPAAPGAAARPASPGELPAAAGPPSLAAGSAAGRAVPAAPPGAARRAARPCGAARCTGGATSGRACGATTGVSRRGSIARFGARHRRQVRPRFGARLRQHSRLLARLGTLQTRNRFYRLGRRRRELGRRLQRHRLGRGSGRLCSGLGEGGRGAARAVDAAVRPAWVPACASRAHGRAALGLFCRRRGQLHRERLLLGKLRPQARQEQQCQRMQHDRQHKRRHHGPLPVPWLQRAVQEQRVSGDGRHDVRRTGCSWHGLSARSADSIVGSCQESVHETGILIRGKRRRPGKLGTPNLMKIMSRNC